MATIHFIDIIGPIYQDLLKKCEKRKISVNLDFQDLTLRVPEPEKVEQFLQTEVKRALANCDAGDKITLAQASSDDVIKISVKNSGRAPLTDDTKAALRNAGYEVRSRFGYDTIISMRIVR